MRQYFYFLWGSFVVRLALFKKMLFWTAFIMIICWIFVLKKPVYQKLYGTPTQQHLTITQLDSFQDIPKQPVSQLKVNGYNIEIQSIKSFQTTSRVIAIDRYNAIGSWYRSNDAAKLYDKIVPQDISLASGNSGSHPECFKFSHSYRLLEYLPLNCALKFRPEEISNNHVIANSLNVQKGLDILKVGDIVAIEGYAIYWNGTGKLRNQRFESAVTLGQTSKYIVDGQKAGLCRQLLITKLTFDGYTFE